MTVLLVVVAVVALVVIVALLWPRRGPVEPAPLESGEAREAVRAVIERRVR